MTIRYAPLMIDIAGLVLTADEARQLAKPSVGGVILFNRNYQSIKQITLLITKIRAIKPNLLVATDHEGGRVQRFLRDFTRLPPMATIGKIYDNNPDEALALAFSCGWVLAFELLRIGVDFSFTPVLDLDYNNSTVIGDRAFHSQPQVVIKLAAALIKAMHKVGMPAVGKHFPGHGFVQPDSHSHLPIDGRSEEALKADISVFSGLFQQDLDAVMPAHIVYSKIDKNPAGFSKKWIKTILQTELAFKGAIFSDDLSMKGAFIVGNITNRVRLALDSGCDMVLICNSPDSVIEVIEQEWGNSEKLHRMRGVLSQSANKKTYKKHLQTINQVSKTKPSLL